jgi:hypothetical protein
MTSFQFFIFENETNFENLLRHISSMQNFESSRESRYSGMALQTMAFASQWLSSDRVIIPTDTNATME